MRISPVVILSILGLSFVGMQDARGDDLPPIHERFSSGKVTEEPDFQKHISPLLGRLGCNGRACHGSFQGRGGFRLSLFGYDFKADMEALLDKESPRVETENPLDSLIIAKPTDEDNHEGGLRYEKGSWQYNVLRRWVESGAKYEGDKKMVRLEVTPKEIIFDKADQKIQLKAIAVWEDGTREDVTPLCRFNSNDDQVALIDIDGIVTSYKPGDTHVVVNYDKGVIPIPVIQPVSKLAGKNYPKTATPTKVDKLVVNKLRKLGIVQSELSSDAEFLRRVSLDLTGTLPSVKVVDAFLRDKSKDKRSQKIEELLNSRAYAAWWATRLSDYTGNNEARLNNVVPAKGQASKEWYQWLYKRVEENTPYDQIAAGIVTAVSRKPEQSYKDYCKEMSEVYREKSTDKFAERPQMSHYWARNEFRTPEERAIGFAYTFMGIRIQCAQCHKHPFDQWTKDDFAQFQNFFANVSTGNNYARDKETKEQFQQIMASLGVDKSLKGGALRKEVAKELDSGKPIPINEIYLMPARRPADPKLLGGDVVKNEDHADVRVPLMDWLRAKDNPYFARAFVNRVWSNYFNVGIVSPPDDMSLANPPSNRELLDYLTQGFIDNSFDMKWLHREIANSRTYQLSWKSNDTNAMDQRNFSHSIPRRLPAEVAYDAILAAVSNDTITETYYDDVSSRAIAIASGNYRNGSGTGASFALQIFGQSTRDTNCDCDRSMEPSLLQTVFLQNDREMLSILDKRNDSWVAQVAAELDRQHVSVFSNNQVRAKPASYDNSIKGFKTKLARYKKTDDNKNYRLTKQKLAVFVKRYGESVNDVLNEDDAPNGDVSTAGLDKEKIKRLVERTYLRSLSRYPNENELQRATQHVEEAKDPVSGIRDLTWVLVNTKEFIVNH
ncbi:MAG: hypothetical protein ACI9G1_005863 [Pirellulaceae bacterium]|jgi:hypothetical protein